MSQSHPYFSDLLAIPNFKKLWTSQLLSQLTINLVNFSILTHIYAQTGSSIAVSLLWISYSLPSLFVTPFSGALVDRFSLKRMMVITNLLQGLTVLTFLLLSGHIFSLYTLVFAYALLDQFYVPAQQSSIPWLVPAKLLPAANGIFFLTQQASFLIGFGLAGLLISLIGQTSTIILASSFLFIAAAAVSLLPFDSARTKPEPLGVGKFWSDFKAAYQFARAHAIVRFPIFLIVLAQIIITVITIILPSYTQEVLGINLHQASLVLIVPAGLAAFAFTLYLPRLLKIHRKKTIIQVGLACASAALLLLGLLSYSPPALIPLAILAAVGLGVSFSSIITPAHTTIQEHTPEGMRGRIYSMLWLLMTMFSILPLLLAATISDLIGVASMMGAFSLLIFAGYLFIRIKGDYVMANGSRI